MTVDSQRAGDLAVLEGCLRIGFSLICAAVCVTSHTASCVSLETSTRNFLQTPTLFATPCNFWSRDVQQQSPWAGGPRA